MKKREWQYYITPKGFFVAHLGAERGVALFDALELHCRRNEHNSIHVIDNIFMTIRKEPQMPARKGKKAQKRLESRIKDWEKIESDHDGAFHKPGSYKK